MQFTTPLALLLLLSLPYFFWLGRPGGAQQRSGRRWAGLILRLFIMGMLVLSLAGAQMVRGADRLAVVFLVDASDSISPSQREAAEAYVRESINSMGPNDRAAVVVFGANALVERPMSSLAELAPVTSVPQPLHTDIAEAVRLGMALFPAGSARRLVLLSDGAATVDDPVATARLAAGAGVHIDFVPLTQSTGGDEAWIEAVDAPTRAIRGATISVDVSVSSTANMPATLRITAGGSVVHEADVQLQAGANNFSIPIRAGEQEFARFHVELVPAQDTYYQNNRLAAFTEVVGPPRILLVNGAEDTADEDAAFPEEAAQLRSALEGAGLPVDQIAPAELPGTLARLNNYASIVLVNVNARAIHPRNMALLQSYVRDLGGGLVAVGGPQSYGMGGYFQTPLEETLPVEMQIKDQERFPSVSMAIVIDRSGSMSRQEGGTTKIQLADEAAVRVVELLNDFDEIAVIPVDTEPGGVIGPAPATDRASIVGQIRQIGAGGGGINVRTGLEAAAEALAESQNQVRHVIVLADGNDSNEQEGVPALIEGLVAEGVTVSMVAIGDGKDVPWLQRMAELGQGRFHLTYEAANLPQIFTQETTAVQRSYLIEERFFPALVARSPMLANISQVPPLYGYVGTGAKTAGRVILETHLGDPLLAAWQYGLGRAVAWTSDATGRWATDWISWDGYPTFWTQVVRWTITQSRDNAVETAVTLSGQEANLTVDARGEDGSYLNDAQMTANVVGPQGNVAGLTLQQIAPGRYQGTFRPDTEGAYLIRVSGEGGTGSVVQTAGWVLGYSPEYRQFQSDEQLLQTMAELTDGRDVGREPAAVFAHDLPAERTTRPIWPWLTLLAVLLLPADVALRRLAIGRRDLQRAWAATLGRLRPEPVTAQRDEQVARLFEAKQRAPTRADSGADAPAETTGAPPLQQAEETPDEAAPKREQPAPQHPERSLASRLLEKRQRQSDDSSESTP